MPPEPDIAAVRAEMAESLERIHRQVESYRRELFRALCQPPPETRPRLTHARFSLSRTEPVPLPTSDCVGINSSNRKVL